jgi:hypothetical protein
MEVDRDKRSRGESGMTFAIGTLVLTNDDFIGRIDNATERDFPITGAGREDGLYYVRGLSGELAGPYAESELSDPRQNETFQMFYGVLIATARAELDQPDDTLIAADLARVALDTVTNRRTNIVLSPDQYLRASALGWLR